MNQDEKRGTLRVVSAFFFLVPFRRRSLSYELSCYQGTRKQQPPCLCTATIKRTTRAPNCSETGFCCTCYPWSSPTREKDSLAFLRFTTRTCVFVSRYHVSSRRSFHSGMQHNSGGAGPPPPPLADHGTLHLHVHGGSIKLLIPISDPQQPVAWLKAEFKARALARGRDVVVAELICNGRPLSDHDRMCDVVDTQVTWRGARARLRFDWMRLTHG